MTSHIELENQKRLLLNEARILGHAEARTASRLHAAADLVRDGKFVARGRLEGGGRWYTISPVYADTLANRPTEGPRVRLTRNDLGASNPENLSRLEPDTYGIGDEGVLAFEHPNQDRCCGWVYIEVDSKIGAPRKLYVAVGPRMYEVIMAPAAP